MKKNGTTDPSVRPTKTKAPRDKRDIWDRHDVAEHFGCSLPHVVKLVRDQELPCIHLGKLIRFRREDVIAWQTEQVKTMQKKGAA
jgi:excisionase family DNA binding protein